MTCFVDTSGLFAVLDADDRRHADAAAAWRSLLDTDTPLITSNYVLVEATALLQHRLGLAAVRSLRDDILPLLEVEWIDAMTHQEALGEMLLAGRRQLSLVDCANFVVMKRLGVDRAFAYDRHFKERGFRLVGT